MVDYYSDFLGTRDKDAVCLRVNDLDVNIWGGYEVKTSMLQQPSAFSFRVGWGDTVGDLLDMFKPGDKFKLLIAGTIIQSGVVEAVNVIPGAAAQVDIKGRDWMFPIFKSGILYERTFQERTYFDLVKRVMEICGVGDHELIASNDANRAVITKTKASPKPTNASQLVEQIETGLASNSGAKVVTQHIKAKCGQTWFQWLDKQLKLAGLLLWAGHDGTFVLGSPNTTQAPLYRIVRQKGQTRNEVNVIGQPAFTNDFTNQHTSIIVNGRQGAGAGGRAKIGSGAVNDDAALAFAGPGGIDMPPGGWLPMVIDDDDVRTQQQANYRALRAVSEERRAGWNIKYQLAGHRIPSAQAVDDMAILATDTIIQVDDDWIKLHEPLYIESVTYRSGPQTTTEIDLIRPGDLQFFAESGHQAKQKPYVRR